MTQGRIMRVAALATMLLVAPLAADGQQAGKVWRIGLFHVGLDHVPPQLDGLREGLRALGYEEGKNVRLDWQNVPNENAAREMARAFVRERVDLIVAFENYTARAAKAATSEIPIVFVAVGDPVAQELVGSLAHPGGNLTGFTGAAELVGKQLEVFKEVDPRLRRVLVLSDPGDPMTPPRLRELRQAAASLKLSLREREVTGRADVERVFAGLKIGDVDGVFVASSSLQTEFTSLVLRLASAKRLPVRAHRREWVERGALFSYGPNFRELGRDAARHIARILQGARPADLPVERPTKFELVINAKTAKALGLAIPPPLLGRADQVIE